MSASSASRCELTDTYSPAAIEPAPATSPARPATSTALRPAFDAATPIMMLATETMPSSAPRTAARSQPIREVLWRSVCGRRSVLVLGTARSYRAGRAAPGAASPGRDGATGSDQRVLAHLLQALSDIVPIDDVPERLDVVGLHVLVLQVERVLPDVDDEQRGRPLTDVVLVVVDLRGVETLTQGIPHERTPPGALHGRGRLGELALEAVEGAEELVDRRFELAFGLAAAVGRHVVPVQRVQHVTREVERERLLEAHDGTEVAAFAGGLELLEGLVGPGDVRRVVLVVVQLDGLPGQVRFERAVVVRHIRQLVSHGDSFRTRARTGGRSRGRRSRVVVEILPEIGSPKRSDRGAGGTNQSAGSLSYVQSGRFRSWRRSKAKRPVSSKSTILGTSTSWRRGQAPTRWVSKSSANASRRLPTTRCSSAPR